MLSCCDFNQSHSWTCAGSTALSEQLVHVEQTSQQGKQLLPNNVKIMIYLVPNEKNN